MISQNNNGPQGFVVSRFENTSFTVTPKYSLIRVRLADAQISVGTKWFKNFAAVTPEPRRAILCVPRVNGYLIYEVSQCLPEF